MDITVRIEPESDTSFSKTFIGDKEKILPDIRAYIQKYEHLPIEVISNEENPDITFQELFVNDVVNLRVVE
tara:strand:- start:240 stop:452 length:213 start_codon:yes stop_codon:yes gene_type:complete